MGHFWEWMSDLIGNSEKCFSAPYDWCLNHSGSICWHYHAKDMILLKQCTMQELLGYLFQEPCINNSSVSALQMEPANIISPFVHSKDFG